ncbi:YifB family Mg chelatase-like AAA ATPase [Flavobacteriaceae bacterium]|nr:YifB family Mg chelatase-like AAA ATPase [Flavobacteriaceae bacterium]
MVKNLKSITLKGIQAELLHIEIDIRVGIGFKIIGRIDQSMRESGDRIYAAISNSNFKFPGRKITINLAPARTLKKGSQTDLAISLGILQVSKQIQIKNLSKFLIIGECSLDGSIKAVPGVLAAARICKLNRLKGLVLPYENLNQAKQVSGIRIIAVKNLNDCIDKLGKQLPPINKRPKLKTSNYSGPDFSTITGCLAAKRSLQIAHCGRHHILLYGDPGVGKSMLAKNSQFMLPNLHEEEALQLNQLESLGKANSEISYRPPFREPHHQISLTSLIGGGRYPRPGELSLAHKGILFLDELNEFPKSHIEALRQVLEDHKITINRLEQTAEYPCDFQLIAALNPKDNRDKFQCSKAIIDRIDLFISVHKPSLKNFRMKEAIKDESNYSIQRARKIQFKRYQREQFKYNARIPNHLIQKYCEVSTSDQQQANQLFDQLELSPRVYHKILRVSRSIADLAETPKIRIDHIREALAYRQV